METPTYETVLEKIISKGTEEVEVTKNDELKPMEVSLVEIFAMEDAVSNVEEGMLEYAHDVINRQCTKTILPAAHCVLRYYHALVKAKAFREIPNVVKNLFNLIQEENEITGKDIQTFARELKDKKKFLDSFLCLLVAAQFYGIETNPSVSIAKISGCVMEIYLTLEHALSCDTKFKSIIICMGIPEIDNLRGKIENTMHVGMKERIVQEAWCKHYIYGCYRLVEYWECCEFPLKQGIRLMRDAFKQDAGKHMIFGRLLHNLGLMYFNFSDFGKSVQYCKLALDATKKATDFATETERSETLRLIEINKDIAQAAKQEVRTREN